MINFFKLALLIYVTCILQGCSVFNSASSKYNFSDGYYDSRLNKNRTEKYYVVTGSDSIKVYPASVGRQIADTLKMLTVLFPPHAKPAEFSNYTFRTQSFELDVLTIIFKYRQATQGFPGQLNANFNGALYAGYRTDSYRLSYKETPLRVQNRDITHYGYSFGGFLGIGTARIDEYVTLNRINYEYDGAVVTGGLAAIIGLNKLNFGITSGS
jgi:hypothetical protein